MLAGFTSGYLSRSLDRVVTCREQTCIAMGDAACRFIVWTETSRDWSRHA